MNSLQKKLPEMALRLGLGCTFLYSGLDLIRHPTGWYWAVWPLPAAIQNLMNATIGIDQYLKDLKKTEKEIFADFTAQAGKRAKAALISRQVAAENNIKIDKKELDAEIELIKTHYGNDPKINENLQRPEVINTVAATVQNRKVMEFLKNRILGSSK